jgi:hypothetical protein
VSTPPGELPPIPGQPLTPAVPAAPTPNTGQQTVPSSVVPTTPAPPIPITQTNTLAVISLIAALASFLAHFLLPLGGGFIGALVAVIAGYMARGQIKRTGEQGMGLATAGIVIGVIHLVIIALSFLALLFFIFVVGAIVFGFHR